MTSSARSMTMRSGTPFSRSVCLVRRNPLAATLCQRIAAYQKIVDVMLIQRTYECFEILKRGRSAVVLHHARSAANRPIPFAKQSACCLFESVCDRKRYTPLGINVLLAKCAIVSLKRAPSASKVPLPSLAIGRSTLCPTVIMHSTLPEV